MIMSDFRTCLFAKYDLMDSKKPLCFIKVVAAKAGGGKIAPQEAKWWVPEQIKLGGPMVRQMAVRVTPEFIADFLKANEICVVVDSKIPTDAKLVSFFERQNEMIGPYTVESVGRTFYFIFEHESFSEIPEGAHIPIVWPKIFRK